MATVLKRKITLSKPVIHGEEREFLKQAANSGFDGAQVKELAKEMAEFIGTDYAVLLSSGTAAMHMAVKLAAEKAYGSASGISTPGGPDSEGGKWMPVGLFGDYSVLDFGNDKIITGNGGGMLLTDDFYSSEKAAFWASHAKAAAPWQQHEELGFSYQMSDLTAATLRGQLRHLDEHIAKKKEIYEGYQKKLDSELTYMNPVGDGTRPNYWMSCMTCESSIQFNETRDDRRYTYTDQHGTAAPMEIYDALEAFNVQSSRVYKPMSMQPIFRNYEEISLDGCQRMYQEFNDDIFWIRCNRAKQYFESGLCLPSGIGMTGEEQDKVMDILFACFDKVDLDGGCGEHFLTLHVQIMRNAQIYARFITVFLIRRLIFSSGNHILTIDGQGFPARMRWWHVGEVIRR